MSSSDYLQKGAFSQIRVSSAGGIRAFLGPHASKRHWTTDPTARQVFVVDTNVVVAGLFGAEPNSPPSRILDAMLEGDLLYLLSSDLLAEYSAVLRRPRIARLHGLTEDELDRLLTELTANAVWRQPSTDVPTPESGDDHLWALLSCRPRSRLVTGDRLLVENFPTFAVVATPRQVAGRFLPTRG